MGSPGLPLTESFAIVRPYDRYRRCAPLNDSSEQVAITDVTNAVLVSLIAAGERSAEAELYRRFKKPLMMILQQRTGDTARAEDMLHETIIVVLDKIRNNEIEFPERLGGYIQQTAKFIFIGWTRRQGNKVELSEHLEEVAHEDSFVDNLERQQTQAIVRELIAQMTVSRDRELLTRFYVHDETKQLVCDSLALSSEQFDRVVSRARQRFKELALEQFS